MTTSAGKNLQAINTYLSSNGLNEKIVSNHYESWKSAPLNAINYILDGVEKGKQFELGIFYDNKKPIRFLDFNTGNLYTTTHTWSEGAGHAVKVIGWDSKGFVISTWGEELLIPFDDLFGTPCTADEVSFS